MNAQFAQLLAQRLGLSVDEIAAVARGDLQPLLAGRAGSDPLLAALLAQMAETRERHPEQESPPAAPMPSLGADELREAVRAAHASLRYVAQVLGACRCWGMNPSCADCEGRGAPGFRVPADESLFLAWIRPGLSRLGLRVVAREPDAQDRSAVPKGGGTHA